MLKNLALILALAAGVSACATPEQNLLLGAGAAAAAIGTGLVIANNTQSTGHKKKETLWISSNLKMVGDDGIEPPTLSV